MYSVLLPVACTSKWSKTFLLHIFIGFSTSQGKGVVNYLHSVNQQSSRYMQTDQCFPGFLRIHRLFFFRKQRLRSDCAAALVMFGHAVHISISILFHNGRRGTTYEFVTIPFHLVLFSAALLELAKSVPVHSLIMSSHLPLFLCPFTVPCRTNEKTLRHGQTTLVSFS